MHTCGGCGIHSHKFVASIMFVLKHFGKNFLHLYTIHSFHQTLKCSNKAVFLMYPDPADVSRFVKLCTLVHYEIWIFSKTHLIAWKGALNVKGWLGFNLNRTLLPNFSDHYVPTQWADFVSSRMIVNCQPILSWKNLTCRINYESGFI